MPPASQQTAIPAPVIPLAWPRILARLLRVHQWSKNLLVFAPVITSHRVFSASVLGASAIMFAIFCCAASAGYILNDILDLGSDRRHPIKRDRPLASGRVSTRAALATAAILLLAAAGLAFRLPAPAALILALYCASTLLY